MRLWLTGLASCILGVATLTFGQAGDRVFRITGAPVATTSRPVAATTTKPATAPTTATAPATAPANAKVSMFGHTIDATRVVFIVDCSGSMLDGIDPLKKECIRAVNALTPVQQVAFVWCREEAVGPKEMVRATGINRQALTDEINKQLAMGKNDDEFAPFAAAIDHAAKLRPDHVILITDGRFNKQLPDYVIKVATRQKFAVHPIAYLFFTPETEARLKRIAEETRGTLMRVNEKDIVR